MATINTKVILATAYEETKVQFRLPNASPMWPTCVKPALAALQVGVHSLKGLGHWMAAFASISGTTIDPTLPTLRRLYEGKSQSMDLLLHKIIPFIAKTATEVETHFPSGLLPVLLKGTELTIKVERKAVAALLACSFFSLFPDEQPNIQMIGCNMHCLFRPVGEPVMESKLLCYLHYFSRILQTPPHGCIYICRSVIKHDLNPLYAASTAPLTEVTPKTTGSIEDNDHALIVDFANEYIGGGFLHTGCVQEELMFLIYPELLTARIFNEVMEPQDAILIRGVEQYCKLEGYAWQFSFAGPAHDPLLTSPPSETIGRDIVAIDALPCYLPNCDQYCKEGLLREIVKAHAGFAASRFLSPECHKPVSTGRWGCGAFRGDPQLKFLIQWLVASFQGRSMIFYLRDDPTLQNLSSIVENARKKLNVGTLYEALLKYLADRKSDYPFFRDLFS